MLIDDTVYQIKTPLILLPWDVGILHQSLEDDSTHSLSANSQITNSWDCTNAFLGKSGCADETSRRRVVSRGRLVSEVINVFLIYAFRQIIENSR